VSLVGRNFLLSTSRLAPSERVLQHNRPKAALRVRVFRRTHSGGFTYSEK
jgi:hypothetical protein